ncbi:MAG TPA: metal-dependent transcriptional regulator [Chitinophagales bacterium]|nr:metal-dependent transcriptional regulator [Chitinophagales bacterium]
MKKQKDISQTEENYLKAIFKLSENSDKNIITNAISEKMGIAAASVTDMLKKLAQKKLINYEKYYGVTLTASGKKEAVRLIRSHRLWETFLVERLNFNWDEVHDMAEELEHIKNVKLTDELEQYLGFPKFDPHGDPIPDKHGNIAYHEEITLDKMQLGDKGVIVGVIDHSSDFLKYLNKIQLVIQAKVLILDDEEYDKSKHIRINNKSELIVSQKVSANLLVRKIK